MIYQAPHPKELPWLGISPKPYCLPKRAELFLILRWNYLLFRYLRITLFYSISSFVHLGEQLLLDFQPTTEVKDLTGLTALIGLLSSSKKQKEALQNPTKNRHSYFHSSSRSFNSRFDKRQGRLARRHPTCLPELLLSKRRFVNRQERGLPTF